MIEEILKNTDYYENQISYYKVIDSKAPTFCNIPKEVEPILHNILKEKNINKIYSHQKEAFKSVEKGENVIVTTPTSSGKTLCFNLPVLNSLLKDPKASFLYVYPTKALSEDQKKRLISYNIKPHKIFSYDGDTPKDQRGFIRQRAKVIFTNPDMLHLGILSSHKQWDDYFHNLKYIIFDEFHHYRGTFASNISAIIRRLRRICSYYGSDPTFILSSATLSNPEEFAYNMTGLDFKVIDKNGAATSKREIFFWNPPIQGIKNETGDVINSLRNSPKEAYRLAITLLNQGKKIIVFPKSRQRVELMVKALREYFNGRYNIMSYRSGYTPVERRKIEKSLFNGEIDAIIATNALELGIDIGTLDAVITVGYPGNSSSLLQQFGRAGRNNKEGIGIFIAKDDLIDQYFMENPKDILEKKLDKSIVNNENEFILFNQISCAISELPMTLEEVEKFFGKVGIKVVGELLESGCVKYNGHFYWAIKESPHSSTNIRGTGGENYNIIEINPEKLTKKEIGICDKAHLYTSLHEGAIYIHEGETYFVKKLDVEQKKAYVLKTDVDYYTNVKENTSVDNVQRNLVYKTNKIEFDFAMCHVTTSLPQFELKKFGTGKTIEKHPLNVPDTKLYTQCVAFTLSDESLDKLDKENISLEGSIHALEHILIGVAPILINCDRNDLGGVSYPLYEDTDKPTVFIYDGYEGGIGITKALFEEKKKWLQIAYETISKCKCTEGCPGCIQSPKCGNNNQPLNKEGAKILLECLIEEIRII